MARAAFLDDKLTPLELRAVSLALEVASRYRPIPGASRDDMRQEAQIRVWQLRKAAELATFADEAHRRAWLAKSALNAIRDLRARVFRENRVGADIAQPLDALEEGERESVTNRLVDLADPLQLLKVNRALQALADMPEPLPRLVALSIAGLSGSDIARALGLCEARISQLRRQLMARLRRHLECIA